MHTQRERSQTIDTVMRWLNVIPEVVSVGLIGSSARAYVSSPGDTDFMVVVDVANPHDFLSKQLEYTARGASDGVAWARLDDVIGTEVDNTAINLAPFTPTVLTQRVESILTAQDITPDYKMWCVSGCASEVLCADIYDAVILLERQDYLIGLKQKLKVYPESLRESLLSFCRDDSRCRISQAERALNDGDRLMFECAFHAALFPVVRGLFALERVYFRGMKHLQAQLSALLPHWISERMLALDCTSTAARERLQVLRQLAAELHT